VFFDLHRLYTDSNHSSDWVSIRFSHCSTKSQIKEIAVEYIKSDEEAAKAKYKEVTGDDDDFDDSIKEYLFNKDA
jgi:hypothetical protein